MYTLIEKLREIFVRFGLTNAVVSDNSPQLVYFRFVSLNKFHYLCKFIIYIHY